MAFEKLIPKDKATVGKKLTDFIAAIAITGPAAFPQGANVQIEGEGEGAPQARSCGLGSSGDPAAGGARQSRRRGGL
ncbi:MAG: hypothetical protein ACJAQT_004452 [Akkermansiaceae bacterium]|jgi:hypothetical protein